MSNTLLFLFKEHTDTHIEQRKTKTQENLKLKLNRQLNNFSYCPPSNLTEQGKRLFAMTSFEATNAVFNTTDENNTFSFSTPGQWYPKGGGEIFGKLFEKLGLRSENDFELHVKEMEKKMHPKRNRI